MWVDRFNCFIFAVYFYVLYLIWAANGFPRCEQSYSLTNFAVQQLKYGIGLFLSWYLVILRFGYMYDLTWWTLDFIVALSICDYHWGWMDLCISQWSAVVNHHPTVPIHGATSCVCVGSQGLNGFTSRDFVDMNCSTNSESVRVIAYLLLSLSRVQCCYTWIQILTTIKIVCAYMHVSRCWCVRWVHFWQVGPCRVSD